MIASPSHNCLYVSLEEDTDSKYGTIYRITTDGTCLFSWKLPSQLRDMSVDDSGRRLVVALRNSISVYDTSTGLASMTLDMTLDELQRHCIFTNAAMCGDDKMVVVVWYTKVDNSEKVIVYKVPTATNKSFVEIHSDVFPWQFRNIAVDSNQCILLFGHVLQLVSNELKNIKYLHSSSESGQIVIFSTYSYVSHLGLAICTHNSKLLILQLKH